MKKILKTILCFSLAVLSIFTVVKTTKLANANSDASTVVFNSQVFFKNQLDPISKSFYNAIEEMDKSGKFKTASSLDLIAGGYITEEQVKGYVGGNSTLASCFINARDAYMTDKNVFYVDFTKLTLRVGKQGIKYAAMLCPGNNDNYFINGISNIQDCENKISQVNSRVDEILMIAKRLNSQVDKIKYIHDEIVNYVDYKYENEAKPDAAPYVHSLYGALIKNESVCEGYARMFKEFCDKLSINNVYVNGLARNSSGELDFHAWNYVEINGKWFAVDTTWNDPIGGALRYTYFLNGENFFSLNHFQHGSFSPSGRNFGYPRLSEENYGVTSEQKGLQVLVFEKVDSDGDNYTLFKISYNGMGPKALEKLGLTIVQKSYADIDLDGPLDYDWSDWFGYEDGTFEVDFNEYYLEVPVYNLRYVQFAITNLALPLPDAQFFEIENGNLLTISDVFENRFEGQYVPPPYVKMTNPSIEASLFAEGTYDVTCTYTENLKLADSSVAPKLRVECSIAGAEKKTKIENFKFDGKSTISFVFTPSPMYSHDRTIYSFYLENIVGTRSEKTPMALNYLVTRPMQTNYFCPFRGEQAFISTVGKPQLIVDEDLSQSNWVDKESGEKIDQGLLYNMVMIASKPNTEKQEQIEELIGADTQGVGNISATYDINIQICNKDVQLDGSYVYLMLGFPDGFDSSDAGTEFTIYHFKEINGALIPEIVPCVVTEYGLIVQVDGFSPFAIVTSQKEEEQRVEKQIFINNGVGGVVSKQGIVNVKKDEILNIEIKSNVDYKIESIVLNGKSYEIMDASKNIVQVRYDELLNNNEIKISYISSNLKKAEAELGIVGMVPVLTVSKNTEQPTEAQFVKNLEKNKKVKSGNELVLAVEMNPSGSGLLTYEWFKDEEKIVGATSGTLKIENFGDDDVGKYKVVVCNTLNGKFVEVESAICSVGFDIIKSLILFVAIMSAMFVAMVVAYSIFKNRKKSRARK